MSGVRLSILALFILSVLKSDARTLEFVQAIWRHGDRAPSELPYPADRYNESYWPRGWSQLTNVGMQQLKQLGTFFKRRYANFFIDQRFNRKQVYVRSSNSDRALVSAQSLLNGLFPPESKEEQFEYNLNWQPIAVHATSPGQPDPLLDPFTYNCSLYNEIERAVKDCLFKSIRKKYRQLLAFLTDKTNYRPFITVTQAAQLADLNKEIAHGLLQPDWVYKRWPQYDNTTTLALVNKLKQALRNSEFSGIIMNYLRGGFLLGDWIKRAQQVIAGNAVEPTKMLLYSSHDRTLMALMNLLNVGHAQLVSFGSCFIMEIHKDKNQYLVEFYYHHDGHTTRVCVSKCCSSMCSLKDFIDEFGSLTIATKDELESTCKLPLRDVDKLSNKLTISVQ